MARSTKVQDVENAADEAMAVVQDNVQERLDIFEETLHAGVGLFSSNPNISKEDWKRFVEGSSVLQRYSGAQAVGFAKVVTAEEVDPFINTAKTLTESEFTISPIGDREVYTPILYLEPFDERNQKVVGYDMFSEEIRRLAMERARDTGDAVISEPVRLRQENGVDEQYGLLMYTPYYKVGIPVTTVQERRAAVQGYVYAAFRARTFISSVASRQQKSTIAYRVQSHKSQIPLYESDNYMKLDQAGLKHHTKLLEMNGVTFDFDFVFDESAFVSSASATRPMLVLFVGMLTAFLVALTILFLLKNKENEALLLQERAINSAKDNLLSIASHQLRTPATGVKQYLGLVLQGFSGDVPPRQSDLLQKAYTSNERQLKVINDVLYMARIDSGRIVLSRKKVEVKALVESLIDELKDEIAAKEHTLSVTLPKHRVWIEVDEHMLRMAVENLLTNAIKYTERAGKIALKVHKKRESVIISVKDNGVGVSDADQEKLFKEFSRIKNELSNQVSGTGIGLYLAKHLVELHGGTISVESIKGKGSIFTITIPLHAVNGS